MFRLGSRKLSFTRFLAILPTISALVSEIAEALDDRQVSEEEALGIGERLIAIVAAAKAR